MAVTCRRARCSTNCSVSDRCRRWPAASSGCASGPSSPTTALVQKLAILGTDVSELIQTISHNIEHGATDARYQRKVMHVGIPIEALPAFREMSARQSQALLEGLDAWLTEHDIEHLPQAGLPVGDTARVGVGIHYFEQLSNTQDSPS